MKKKCPRCGGERFHVTAHVTQGWIVDEAGNWLVTVSECEETVHEPDDDDVWQCAACGYDAAGREFNIGDDDAKARL